MDGFKNIEIKNFRNECNVGVSEKKVYEVKKLNTDCFEE